MPWKAKLQQWYFGNICKSNEILNFDSIRDLASDKKFLKDFANQPETLGSQAQNSSYIFSAKYGTRL